MLAHLTEKEEKYFVYKKFHNLFTHHQVIKYTLWFNQLSKNNQRTVILDDLAQEFVDHKLIRCKIELVNAFSTFLKAKIKHNDASYTVNIDEVLDVLSKSSRIIDMDKFNDLVDVANKLSEKTLLIHERRKLLLEHVVEERFERASDMEIMLDRSLKSTLKSCCAYAAADSNSFRDPDHNRALEDKNDMNYVLESHRKQIEESNRFVGKVEFDFYCMKYGSKLLVKPMKTSSELLQDQQRHERDEREEVLQPLDKIFDPNLLEMAGSTIKILYEDKHLDELDGISLSPTKELHASRKHSKVKSFCANEAPTTLPCSVLFHFIYHVCLCPRDMYCSPCCGVLLF
jgi:hypothetical protein